MLQELNRRLDAIGGYIDCVSERSEANMPRVAPPYPNRLLRRQEIEKQIEESLFAPNLEELHGAVPQNFVGAEFIRQLLEAETREEALEEARERSREMVLDRKEYLSLLATRRSENAPQHV